MTATAESAARPIGVIDALRRGFDLINHHPWLLLLPLLLDVALWRGPRLSVAPLLSSILDFLLGQPDLPAEMVQNTAMFRDNLVGLGSTFNLLGLLTGTVASLPSLLARLDAAGSIPAVAPVYEIADVRLLLLYLAALIPAGLLASSIWLSLLVQSLQGERRGLLDTLRHIGWIWLNAGLYLAGLILALVITSGLFAFSAAMLALVVGPASFGFVNVVWLLFLWGILWVSIGLTFVVGAIALDGVNVARATWRSLNVVGRNLTATLGLILLILVLTEGFARIWLRLSASSWGVPVGMLGNAYIGAALTAAALVFYQARYRHWQRIRSAVASARRQQRSDSNS